MNKNKRKDVVCIGRISAAHGIHGAVRMVSSTEWAQIFEPGSEVIVVRGDQNEFTLRISAVKPHRKGVMVQFQGIENRDQADAFAGSEIYIEKSRLPDLEEGDYYWHELIGLDVWTIDDRLLGRITAIIETGSNDVYVVRQGDREVLVPAIVSVVRDIDLAKGTVRVDLPEGLEEL